MDKKMGIRYQIEETRQILNNKLLQNTLNKDTIDTDILNISWKLDKLIAQFMKEEILHK
ncbi:MAG: Spo0E family sporulation regulatory protein-aspartic acid phosphatase [Clostridium sp.]|uniref:Spo0E like sporulation regulatory protein n=1 Tax=Clostridium coskatii TaxID=1705578 RepID=A0A162LGU8_9CLOT|nr:MULTISPECIES: Spo0E family sporulation regulatory protein-aspartic acid phosphatase [Clostridium]MCH3964617.1 Spo0E family sporulation regulatory protein-aspartic acid phosphatase [Clostridium sp.]MCH4198578.1 Spo0E family sporulation regulatory protein-aspartic acid phosphatase [Clostridium tyrobutyricum]MCH4258887.1 Spo0E family sporulation regulatory protein-aspartic acid phosphatase [Clostridium tyrobutyricum]MCI1239765.1 Spo0E family sporulation regulatory protein-aspartic acid phosphat